MKLYITNKDGKVLDLLGNSSRFVLTHAEGLHGIDTDIGTSESPYMDGVHVTSVKALPRGITLTLKLKSDVAENIAFVQSVIKSKQTVTLTEEEGEKKIAVQGVVTIPPFSRMQIACAVELSIYCPKPYWEDIYNIVGTLSRAIDMLNFPGGSGQHFTEHGIPFGVINESLERTITNDGDVAVGMLIRIIARGPVKNPALYCSTGEQNGNFMRLAITMKEGDEVQISTVTGEKFTTLNGRDSYLGKSLLTYLTFKGHNWLQLETGANTFNAVADEGAENIQFLITYRRRFE